MHLVQEEKTKRNHTLRIDRGPCPLQVEKEKGQHHYVGAFNFLYNTLRGPLKGPCRVGHPSPDHYGRIGWILYDQEVSFDHNFQTYRPP